MAMNFADAEDRGQSFDLIPDGTLAFAIVTVRGIKKSQNPNKDGKMGSYLDVELIISEGDFTRRKFWSIIVDPTDSNNTEKGRQMGETAIKRILESDGSGMVIGELMDLSGRRAGVKIGIEKGTQGYPDKNKVIEFLTPNTDSTGNKGWLELTGSQSEVKSKDNSTAKGGQKTPNFLHDKASPTTELDDEIPF